MRVIVISSGKGGVGKTTCAANLGVGLGRLGLRVVLVDMDMGLRNLDVALGLEDRVFYHMIDVTAGRCSLDDALLTDERYPNLSFLPASQSVQEEELPQEALLKLTAELQQRFDIVLLDSPAGIGKGFRTSAAAANEAVVVTTPTVPAVRDADRVLHLLEDAGIRSRSLLVNRQRPAMVEKGTLLEARDISDILGVPLLGVVPEDDDVLVFANEGSTAIGSNTPAGRAFERIARRMNGEEVAIPTGKKKWLFGRRYSF